MGANGIYGLSGSGLDVESLVRAGMMGKQSQLDKMQQTYTKNEWKKEAFLDIYKEVNNFNLKKLTDYKLSSNMNARVATSSDSAINATANSDAALGQHFIKINSAPSNAYLVGTASVENLKDAGAETLSRIGYNEGLKFIINNKEINVTGETTVYGLINEIKNSGAGVNVSYDSDNGSMAFYATSIGPDINIYTKDDDTAKFLGDLGLKDRSVTNGDAFNSDSFKSTVTTTDPDTGKETVSGGVTAKGSYASVNIDGKDYENITTTSIYAFGVTYNIGAITEDNKDKTYVVNVSQDTEKIVDNVKSFVESYNELLGKLYDAYSESPNSSYKPLTDAQKAEMTAEQISKWEEKARSGMLYHDQTLRQIINEVRSSVTSLVDNDSNYNSIFKLGISTTGLQGQLNLDEDKLRKAIAADGNAVYNVFAKSNDDTSTSGVAVRLSSTLNDATKSIKSVAGRDSSTSDDSTLNTLLKSMQQRISNFQKMMKTYEDNLYKRYDAMEISLASLGSQMNYVSSLFAS